MTTIPERVRRIAHRFQRPARCIACHVPRGGGRRLISGPGVAICETCVSVAAAQLAPETADRCSFCTRRDPRQATIWPNVTMCHDCVGLAMRIFADDARRPSRPAT